MYIIYTKNKFFLTKHNYSSWKEIQEKYSDYKTSLGNYSKEEVISFLTEDYKLNDSQKNLLKESIDKFEKGTQMEMELDKLV